MDTEKNTVLKEVGETLTEKPKYVEVDVKPKNWMHRLLIKAKIKPSKRLFEIKPQRVQNVYRIATRAVSMDVGAFKGTDGIGALMKLMAKHGQDIIYIVATAIQNDHREPTKAMIDIVKDEFEMEDLNTVLTVAVNNYNIPAFFNSIVLIVGVNALSIPDQTSPTVEGS